MADIELFFATPKPLGYLCTLGVGFVVSALWFFIRARKEKAPAAAMAALVLSLVLGGLFARLLYLLVEVGELPFVAEAFLHPEDVREFSFSGAILGVVLAAWLAEKGFGAKGLMNALAAPGLLMISIARLAECFVPFGTGQYLNGGFMQFFPLAMPDGYGEWMLSVWLLEALWALGSLWYVVKRKNAPSKVDMLLAITLYHGGQVYLESLRAESLSYGFIKIAQLFAAFVLFFVLLRCAKAGQKKGMGKRMLAYIVCVLLYIAAEFALDRLTWPNYIVRLMMVPLTIAVLYIVLDAVFAVERQRLASGKEME